MAAQQQQVDLLQAELVSAQEHVAKLSLELENLHADADAPATSLPGAARLDMLPDGEVLQAESLWKDQPVVLMLVRRPGWGFCRAEVDKVGKHRAELREMGVGMAAILRENLPSEVKAFREAVWKDDPIYLDGSYALYSAIGGGKPKETSKKYFGTQAALMKEGKADADFVANMQKSSKLAEGYMDAKHHNMLGQGLMHGGVYIVKRGGEVQFVHHEGFIGHTADVADILEAAKKAVEDAA